MACQWIDEFDQLLWSQDRFSIKLRDEVECFCLTVLKRRGMTALTVLLKHAQERKHEFECMALKCGAIEKLTGEAEARLVVGKFWFHYKNLVTKFKMAQSVLELLCDML
jgi:hypothetical protein